MSESLILKRPGKIIWAEGPITAWQANSGIYLVEIEIVAGSMVLALVTIDQAGQLFYYTSGKPVNASRRQVDRYAIAYEVPQKKSKTWAEKMRSVVDEEETHFSNGNAD